MKMARLISSIAAALVIASPVYSQGADQADPRAELHACLVAQAADCDLDGHVRKIEWQRSDVGLIKEIAGLLTVPDDKMALGIAYILQRIGTPAVFTAEAIRASANARSEREARGGIRPMFGHIPHVEMWEIADRMQGQHISIRPVNPKSP